MKWNIDDVPIYMAVVDQNGISAAANYLNMPKSTVSKSLTRLEQALGVRLLERNSRNIRITSEGEAFYRHGLLIMEQVDEANAVMGGLTSIPIGRLVVALPMAFSREIVAGHLQEFREQYPDIDLEIIVTSHPVDIIRDQIDLAVVVGAQPDSDLIVKTLYQSALVWVTSPDYAKSHDLATIAGATLATTKKALISHINICEKRYAEKRLAIRIDGHKDKIDLSQNTIHVNDPITVREAVIHGCGVSFVPEQYCKRQLANGQLVKVFEHICFDTSASALLAIYPSRRLISNKTRAFLDFLVDLCERL